MLTRLNDKFFPILKKISLEEDASIDDIIEECVLEYLNISLLDLNTNDNSIEEYDESTNYRFYIYVLVNKNIKADISIGPFDINFEPFYIGKGTGKRICSTKNDLVEQKKQLLNNNYEEIILKDNLSSLEAHRIENNLITIIGKELDNTGPLLNITGGVNFNKEEKIIENLNLEKAKNRLILKALNESKTKRIAAKKLEISERSLYRMCRDLKIKKKNGLYHFDSDIKD